MGSGVGCAGEDTGIQAGIELLVDTCEGITEEGNVPASHSLEGRATVLAARAKSHLPASFPLKPLPVPPAAARLAGPALEHARARGFLRQDATCVGSSLMYGSGALQDSLTIQTSAKGLMDLCLSVHRCLMPINPSQGVAVASPVVPSGTGASVMLTQARAEGWEDRVPCDLGVAELKSYASRKAALYFHLNDSLAEGCGVEIDGVVRLPKRVLRDTGADCHVVSLQYLREFGISSIPGSDTLVTTSSGGEGRMLGTMPRGTMRTVLGYGTDKEVWTDQPFFVADGVEELYDLLIGTPGLKEHNAWVEPHPGVLRYHPDFATMGSSRRSCTVPIVTSVVGNAVYAAQVTQVLQSFGVRARPEWMVCSTKEGTGRKDLPVDGKG